MNRAKQLVTFAVPAWLLLACHSTSAGPITRQPFGTTKDGQLVEVWRLENANGLRAKITNYGATLVEMWVPDRRGRLRDVVLGFDDVSGYESEANQYFGCTTGRVANRIAKGRFSLDGLDYVLATNNPPNHLHGGEKRSLDKVVWRAEDASGPDGPAVSLSYVSPHSEEGYPGKVEIRVVYTLTHRDELRIDYYATADRRTPINLTNHAYWNLHGAGNDTILDHELIIAADQYTPTDDTLIPTGKIEPVAGTPLDFRERQTIGKRIAQLEKTAARGYDHNFVLRGPAGVLRLVAEVRDPRSGRTLEISTTEPGLQLYSGNFLNGAAGKGGRAYVKNGGLCLEAQHFPDSVNQPSFPSTILEANGLYQQTTVHRFSVR